MTMQSDNTKRAMGEALKELLKTKPLSKVTVENICEKCGMTRQSFYYHFTDKFELVNWIFNTEYIEKGPHKKVINDWDGMLGVCTYLYDQRAYYRKIIEYNAQNSFTDYCREIISPIIRDNLENEIVDERSMQFHIDFFADAMIGSLARWLEKSDMTPEQLIAQLKSCAEIIGGLVEK